jgi:hypothetical protein
MSGFRSLFLELQLAAGRRKAAACGKLLNEFGVSCNPVLKHGAIFWSLKTGAVWLLNTETIRALETGTVFRT